MDNSLAENVIVKIDPKTKEILAKTEFMFSGYFGQEEETSNCMENGFFRTGDLGYFKDKKLYISGRKKNLLKTSEGKEYDPEELEMIYSSCLCKV